MTKFKKEDIERIINNLGGVENILNVRSCATRAKITVVDMKYVNNDALDAETTVIKGHFCTDNNVVQLIIGTDRIPSFINLMNQVMEESGVSVSSFEKQEQNPNQPHDQKILNPFTDFLMEIIKEAGVPTKAQNQSPDHEVGITLTKADIAKIEANIRGIISNLNNIQEILKINN